MKHHIYTIDSTLKNEELIKEVRHYNTQNRCQSLVVLYNTLKQGTFDIFVYSYLDPHPLLVGRFHSVRGVLNYLFSCPFKNIPFFSINACYYEPKT